MPGGRLSTLARAIRERVQFDAHEGMAGLLDGDPWTRGSYAAYLPGQVTKYWGYGGIPEGRVHFAGEHTSTYSQGFLNGGVESGQRAAIEVLIALGLPVPPGIASLPYSRIPGEHIGVGDRW